MLYVRKIFLSKYSNFSTRYAQLPCATVHLRRVRDTFWVKRLYHQNITQTWTTLLQYSGCFYSTRPGSQCMASSWYTWPKLATISLVVGSELIEKLVCSSWYLPYHRKYCTKTHTLTDQLSHCGPCMTCWKTYKGVLIEGRPVVTMGHSGVAPLQLFCVPQILFCPEELI